MKKIMNIAVIAALTIIGLSACTEEGPSKKDFYLNLDIESYTFSYTGDERITVSVETNGGTGQLQPIIHSSI